MKSITRLFGISSFSNTAHREPQRKRETQSIRGSLCGPHNLCGPLWPFIYFKSAYCFFLVSVVLIMILTSCMHPPKRFTEARLVIGSKETVSISELGMTIRNDGCGRKWISKDDKPAFERPFCGITVRYKDSAYHFGDSFEPLYIRNLKLVVDKMNPWGQEEDSIPAGGCRVIVSRLDDLSR